MSYSNFLTKMIAAMSPGCIGSMKHCFSVSLLLSPNETFTNSWSYVLFITWWVSYLLCSGVIVSLIHCSSIKGTTKVLHHSASFFLCHVYNISIPKCKGEKFFQRIFWDECRHTLGIVLLACFHLQPYSWLYTLLIFD